MTRSDDMPKTAAEADSRLRRGLVVYNPVSGRGLAEVRLPRVIAGLERAGYAIDAQGSKAPGDITQQARQAGEEGYDVVFVLGGDGTLREAAAGLVGRSTAVAPLPFGTANVIAGALGVPPDLERACALYADARACRYDVGLCDDQPFLMQASAGLDGRVLQAVDPGWKSRWGRAAVGLAGLMEWWRYDYPSFEVEIDGRVRRASFVAVCNLAQYGGQKSLIPGARPNDGKLDFLCFSGTGRAATLAFGRDFLLGRHVDRRDVEVGVADSVIARFDRTVITQLDGDAIGEARQRVIRLAAEPLQMLVTLADGSGLWAAA